MGDGCEESEGKETVMPNCVEVSEKVRRYPNNPMICTKDDEIRVGGEYDYHETGPSINVRVRVLEDRSDEEFVRLLVEWLAGDQGVGSAPSEISMRHGQFGYGGMHRLFDAGTYVPVD